MMTSTWTQPIGLFLQQASSSSPTPGGGSAAALTAALGAAMTAMVSNLSTGEKYEKHQPQFQSVIANMQQLDKSCEQLLQDDITAFEQYMAAIKLPKSDTAAIAARQQRIREATVLAIEVPLALIEVCRKGMENASLIAHAANKNVISDLGIGVILFEAAAQSALLTIEINLSSLRDSTLQEQYREQLTKQMVEIEKLKSETLLAVNNVIKK